MTDSSDHQPDMDNDVEEEEFLIHLKFDHGSYPMCHNVRDIHFLGMVNGHMMIQIGNSYFMGQYDQHKNSSVLFGYDKQHENISETHNCRSKIFMKRILLKPKETPRSESDKP